MCGKHKSSVKGYKPKLKVGHWRGKEQEVSYMVENYAGKYFLNK